MESSIWVAVITTLRAPDTFFDDHLLREDNFFNRDLNAHIATRNHDAVRRFEDFRRSCSGLPVLRFWR